MPGVDEYSLVSIPLTLVSIGPSYSSATGFFYVRGNKIFWVSNWHVFSGRNPISGQPMKSNGSIPEKVVFPLHLKKKLGHWRNGVTVDLCNSSNRPAWLQHPKGQDIDVAVLPFSNLPDDCTFYEAVRPSETSDLLFVVGMDVFIVGFPLGLSKQDIIPVWKRGSVASEPALPADGLPLFLVDAATREGMSGSPVYARTFGNAPLEGGGTSMGGDVYTRFLGVYSGRYGADDEFAAQLGRVWHRSVLDEVIDQGTPGSYMLR
ncbi:MAG: serine protease [Hyphomicrobiaceae bacterium]